MAVDSQKVTYFAKTNSRGQEVPFGIKRCDRQKHMYVIGKTGMGKSTLLENLAIQDIRNGEGLTFIDPHGGTADKLLEYVPEHRINDVVYFAPFDMDFPIAFNVMEDVGYDKRHLVVSGLMAAFRKIWVDAWSARMEYILQNVLLALLEYPGSTLLDVNTMLINKAFRAKVVENIGDPIVKKFWAEEFAGYSDRYTQDATPAIQNKIGQFANNPLIRNIIGQAKSSFDFRQAMDEKKIIIINLSKGRVGESNGALLGSMLVTKLYLSAMSRADVPASVLARLPDHYFYVDEFQNFANKSFIDILSEARKYKLNLVIAHQFIEQVEEDIRNAVFGNVGTTIVFRVGPFDAKTLETLFEPTFMAADIVNLGARQIYLTLMIDGVGSQPFSAATLPPFEVPPQIFVEQVIAASRRQFAHPREEVEKAVADWQTAEPPMPPEASKSAGGGKSFGGAARPPAGGAGVGGVRPFAPRAFGGAGGGGAASGGVKVVQATVTSHPNPLPVTIPPLGGGRPGGGSTGEGVTPSVSVAVPVSTLPSTSTPIQNPTSTQNPPSPQPSPSNPHLASPLRGEGLLQEEGAAPSILASSSVSSAKSEIVSTPVSTPAVSETPAPRPVAAPPFGTRPRPHMPLPHAPRVMDSARPLQASVRPVRPVESRPERPPLEGTSSLREALLRVGGAVPPVLTPTRAPQSVPIPPPQPSPAAPSSAPAPEEKKSSELGGLLRAVAPRAGVSVPVQTQIRPSPQSSPSNPHLASPLRGEELLQGEGANQTRTPGPVSPTPAPPARPASSTLAPVSAPVPPTPSVPSSAAPPKSASAAGEMQSGILSTSTPRKISEEELRAMMRVDPLPHEKEKE